MNLPLLDESTLDCDLELKNIPLINPLDLGNVSNLDHENKLNICGESIQFLKSKQDLCSEYNLATTRTVASTCIYEPLSDDDDF